MSGRARERLMTGGRVKPLQKHWHRLWEDLPDRQWFSGCLFFLHEDEF